MRISRNKLLRHQNKFLGKHEKGFITCWGLMVIFLMGILLLYGNTQRKQQVMVVGQEIVEQKKVALTFDDGPNPMYTEKLLDGLSERNVVATFFVIGKKVEEHKKIIQRMDKEGHLIGNHTYSHIQLSSGNEEIYKAEVNKTNQILKEITGKDTLFIRPPYGIWNEEYESELNMFPVLWTVDPLDWCTLDTNKVVQRVLGDVGENDIILLHDDYETSVEAALVIVDQLKKEGYEFVTVDEILFD